MLAAIEESQNDIQIIQHIIQSLTDNTHNIRTNLPNTRHTTVHSAIGGLTTDLINDILHEGRVFAPENFLENYDQWPEDVKNKWTFRPVTMFIDGEEEVVGYEIRDRVQEEAREAREAHQERLDEEAHAAELGIFVDRGQDLQDHEMYEEDWVKKSEIRR